MEDFIKRLEIVLEYYGLNASSFADKIGVQRSNMSHLLSGRNKPSLDFILKIVAIFPDVDLYWILYGKGTFPKSELKIEKSSVAPSLVPNNQIPNAKIVNTKIESQPDLFSENRTPVKNHIEEDDSSTYFTNSQTVSTPKKEVDIDRIVIFYKNGNFKTYSPE